MGSPGLGKETAHRLPPLPNAAGARPALKIVTPEHREVYRTLRQYPLLDGIPNEEIEHAIMEEELQVRSFFRDELVLDDQTQRSEGGRIYLVKSGQVAVARFAAAVLAGEREWLATTSPEDRKKKVRHQGPLMKLAEKNLATFGEGDLWNSEALPAAQDCAFFAVQPTEVIVVSKRLIGALTQRYAFFSQRLRRAVEVARDRLGGVSGIKQEIFDFYIRHGLSVAETLRVRQVDRCIECKECEIACEERYGHNRLQIFGPRLGMLDFVHTCRTCVDQRCIDPCNYDSIKFDLDRREVVINESTCTGCSACAVACPYGAIEMVEIDNPAKHDLKLRLDASGALTFGEGTGRKAKLEKIASKCDHCVTYTDQACISRCPTGALIEIKPMDIFKDQGDVSRIASRSGYEHTVMVPIDEMLPEQPFAKGLGITDFGDAKVKRFRLSPYVLWGVSLLAMLVSMAEVALRMWKPTMSLQYAALRLEGLEPEIAALKVSFRAGCDLAVNFGYIGTALMVISLLYPLRKQWSLLRRLSTSQTWFDLHIVGGIVGPIFIVLHSAMKLDNWVSSGFWSMIIVVLSGIAGRYLVTQVPELLHGRELDELEHERSLASLRASSPAAVAAVDRELTVYRAGVLGLRSHGIAYAMLWLAFDELRRPGRWLVRMVRTRGASAVTSHASALMLSARRRSLIPQIQVVLASWKKVHIWFTAIMTVLTVIHVIVALLYSM